MRLEQSKTSFDKKENIEKYIVHCSVQTIKERKRLLCLRNSVKRDQ